jgi:hypothetical protein
MAVSGKKLAKRRGAVVKVWQARSLNPENPYSISLQIDDLLPLISSKSRIVAFTACSNILGSTVREVTQAIRADAKFQGAKKVKIMLHMLPIVRSTYKTGTSISVFCLSIRFARLRIEKRPYTSTLF